jgi:3-hydroxyacyl-CoA dehydrogenase
LKNVSIIGSGVIGCQIAMTSAAGGYQVTMIDRSQEILDNAKKVIQTRANQFYTDFIKNHKDHELPNSPALINLKEAQKQNDNFAKILERIHFSANLEEGVAHADLVIEAVFEKLQVKQDVFEQIDKHANKNCALATNTSGLKLSDVGKKVTNKTHFGGLHFFGPMERKRLLEVGKINETSDETLLKLQEYGATIGKVTVTVKDSPGLICNRLHIPLRCEALHMVEEGIATAHDIDIAMKLGYELPVGIFEHMDTTPGLDTQNDILMSWWNYRDEIFARPPSKILAEKVAQGKLGKKTGEGFYKWD